MIDCREHNGCFNADKNCHLYRLDFWLPKGMIFIKGECMTVLIPELVKMDGFSIVGLKVRTKNENELNPETAQIHQLWEQFFTDKIMSQNPESSMYGVYSDYESDCNGLYTVTAGVQAKDDSVESTLSTVAVKEGEYLVFKNSGEIPQVIYETWQIIWAYFSSHPELTRAYDTDFELCSGANDCAIYIGIKK